MNIFEALSQGKGSINEENTSSFLAYLLDPQKDHGLGKTFLSKFIDKVVSTDIDKKEMKCLDTQVFLEKSSIDDFESNIDISINFHDKDKVFYKICIENKINIQSIREGQLEEEYKEIKKYSKGAKIFMVYLTPKKDNKKAKKEFNKLKKLINDCKNVQHIEWKEIIEIIASIKDNKEKYTNYILNSFCEYIKNIIYNGRAKFFNLHIDDFEYNGDFKIIKYSSEYFRLYRKDPNKTEYNELFYRGKKSMKKIFLLKLYLYQEKNSKLNEKVFTNLKDKLKNRTTDNLARKVYSIANNNEVSN